MLSFTKDIKVNLAINPNVEKTWKGAAKSHARRKRSPVQKRDYTVVRRGYGLLFNHGPDGDHPCFQYFWDCGRQGSAGVSGLFLAPYVLGHNEHRSARFHHRPSGPAQYNPLFRSVTPTLKRRITNIQYQIIDVQMNGSVKNRYLKNPYMVPT